MTRKKTWLCLGAALLILAGTAAGGYFGYRDRQSQPVTVTADQAQELPAVSRVSFHVRAFSISPSCSACSISSSV